MSQCLKLAVVKSKVLDQILAYHHRPGLGEDKILLGIAFHASGDHDDRNSELILCQEVAGGVESLLVLHLGRIAAIEKLLGCVGKCLFRQ